MDRAGKAEAIKTLEGVIADSGSVIVARYTGLTVAEMTKFRGMLREQGVDVMVSSWNRMAPNTFPAMSKTCANYMNSQLIKMEAIKNGYVEGIALDVNGFLSEGSGGQT